MARAEPETALPGKHLCALALRPRRSDKTHVHGRSPIAGSATLAPLANPRFRELWLASQVSNLGSLIQAVGAAWAMGQMTTSHSMVALVQSSNTLPIMVFSLISGALADSFDRRRIMLVAQLFMCVVSAGLTIVAFAGGLTPWLLLGFTFLIGCGGALFNPAWQASIGDIVPREQVPGAVGLNSMGFNLARSVGPAIGGAVVAAAGASTAFAVNAVSYLGFLAGIVRLPKAERDPILPREGVAPAIGAGVRYLAMSPALMRVMARAALFGLGASSVLALLPLYTRDTMMGGALAYGVFLGCFGLGAIGGALLNARLRAALRNERVVEIGFGVFALAAFTLAFAPVLWAVVPALVIAGASWVLALSLFNTTVQLSTPRWVLGRALAFYQMAAFGGLAGGAWIWGWIADHGGITMAFSLSAGVLVIGGLAGWVFRVSDFGEVDLTPLGLITAAEPRLDLRGRSGPIFVMVDYEIAQVDVPAFLRLMQERRRIRKRDGARRWALLRDLERPEIWSEKYYVPTWTDYARHLARRTKADDAVHRAIVALHRGAQPPRVVRKIERQTVPGYDDTPPLPPADMV